MLAWRNLFIKTVQSKKKQYFLKELYHSFKKSLEDKD